MNLVNFLKTSKNKFFGGEGEEIPLLYKIPAKNVGFLLHFLLQNKFQSRPYI